jgi:hypothetical protein
VQLFVQFLETLQLRKEKLLKKFIRRWRVALAVQRSEETPIEIDLKLDSDQ